jgi:hypothetical protein
MDKRGAKPFVYYAYPIKKSLNPMKYIGFLSQRGGKSLLSRCENLPIFFVSGQRLLSEYKGVVGQKRLAVSVTDLRHSGRSN